MPDLLAGKVHVGVLDGFKGAELLTVGHDCGADRGKHVTVNALLKPLDLHAVTGRAWFELSKLIHEVMLFDMCVNIGVSKVKPRCSPVFTSSVHALLYAICWGVNLANPK